MKKREIKWSERKGRVAVLGFYYRDFDNRMCYHLYLTKTKDGLEFTPDRKQALRYNAYVKKGEGTPEEWIKIISEENPDWPKLHAIYFTPPEEYKKCKLLKNQKQKSKKRTGKKKKD
jgi:hypothetical protein